MFSPTFPPRRHHSDSAQRYPQRGALGTNPPAPRRPRSAHGRSDPPGRVPKRPPRAHRPLSRVREFWSPSLKRWNQPKSSQTWRSRLRSPSRVRRAPSQGAIFLLHRLRARRAQWAAAGAPAQVLSWIRDGVRVQWASDARPRPFDLGPSCTDVTPAQAAFLQSERERCVQQVGSWLPCADRSFVSRAFLVPKPGVENKWRLVVDLRPLNAFCRAFRQRSETLTRLRTLARKNDWMISMDLQDGYNMLGIAPEDRKYFCFDIQGELFCAAALPFGWNYSSYAFCHTVGVWVAWIFFFGYQLTLYGWRLCLGEV